MNHILVITGIILAGLTLIGILTITSLSNTNELEIIKENPNIDYEIIYIENMPCVYIDKPYVGALTCDWSKWSNNDIN